ncbi:MAG: hypothetical protein LJE62_14335 [Silicimonas sp.]|nr:hypothetical protein [Silicimonas sp.]
MRRILSLYRRRWRTAIVTLALAFLSGHLMQSVLVEPSWPTGSARGPLPTPMPPEDNVSASLVAPPVLPTRVAEARLPRTASCTPVLTLDPAPAATVRVGLAAPCHANTRVSLLMGNLAAQVETDAHGRWSARLPALREITDVSLSFGGRFLAASVETPDAASLQHVILAWDGAPTFHITAFEFGAHAREDGHVWSGAPSAPERALQGAGGFLTRVGDGTGPAFEIYSFPATGAEAGGVVRVAVDAGVTEENCGQLVRATAFQTGYTGELSPTDVAFSMPGCDRVGDVVRLQNLFRDMRLASR